MKKYLKPIISKQDFLVSDIASLSTWLSENSLTDAEITTYVINS